MTKRGTRLFFLGGTLAATLVLLVLTVDSHRQFPRLTHAERITPAVVAGKHVWHRKNCVNCHTLMGEGAYYAPDLTKITEQRKKERNEVVRDTEVAIAEKDRRFHWAAPGPRPADVPGLGTDPF